MEYRRMGFGKDSSVFGKESGFQDEKEPLAGCLQGVFNWVETGFNFAFHEALTLTFRVLKSA